MWKVKVKSNFSFAKLARELPEIIDNSLEDIGKDSADISKKNIDKQARGNIGTGKILPIGHESSFIGSKYKSLEQSTINKRRAGLYVRNEKVKPQTGTTPLKYTNKLYDSIKGNKKGLYMEHYGELHHRGIDTPTRDIHGFPITIKRNVQPVRAFIGAGMSEKSEKKFYDKLKKGLKK